MNVLVYEFYFRNMKNGDKLIGILPERRKTPERITQESIMNWAKIVFGNTLDVNEIYLVPINLEKSSSGNYIPRP
jgi:hypothetical protein